jgi:hypothetical protein
MRPTTPERTSVVDAQTSYPFGGGLKPRLAQNPGGRGYRQLVVY